MIHKEEIYTFQFEDNSDSVDEATPKKVLIEINWIRLRCGTKIVRSHMVGENNKIFVLTVICWWPDVKQFQSY